MNRPVFFGLDRTAFVDRFAEHVEDAARALLLPTGTVTGFPVSTTSMPRIMPSVLPKCDRANATATEVLLDFTDQIDRHAFVFRS